MAKVIREMCQCDFQESLISQAVLLCEEKLPTISIYRARIFRYRTYSASQLVDYVDEWVKQGASITVGGLAQVTFDQDCPVRIQDVDEPVCVEQPTAEVTLMSATSPNLATAAADQSLATTILGVSVVSAVSAVVFIVLITIIVALLVLLHRKKKKL